MRSFMIYTFFIISGVILIVELYIRLFSQYCEPYFDKKEKIVKRKRNMEGVYKTEYTCSGYFKINNEGWNSYRDYYQSKENGDWNTDKYRIAIVGHSNIEGLRVLINKTLSRVLEDDLNDNGIHAEVFTFGYGGMHLAQAMHISRYAVQKFKPDILVIGTMLDDFWVYSTNKKNFLNLRMDKENKIQEILPKKYVYEENSPFSFLYFSKLIYFFDKRTGIGEKIHGILKRASSLNNGIEKQESDNEFDQIKAYRYIINEFSRIAQMQSKGKIPIIFLKFPRTISSYNDDLEVFHLSDDQINKSKLTDIICEGPFEIIYLEKAFMDDYTLNSQKFDFENDYHYNAHAHKLIGLYLSNYLKQFFLQDSCYMKKIQKNIK